MDTNEVMGWAAAAAAFLGLMYLLPLAMVAL